MVIKFFAKQGLIDILPECETEALSWPKRVARLVRRQCEAEQVVITSEENIVFTRTLPGVPPVYSAEEWSRLIVGRTLHEFGPVSNICADWELLLTQGLLGRRDVAVIHVSAWKMIRRRWSSWIVPLKPLTRCWNWLPVMQSKQECWAGLISLRCLKPFQQTRPTHFGKHCNHSVFARRLSGWKVITMSAWGVSTSTCGPSCNPT